MSITKHQIVFDNTNNATMKDSDNIGAYVRSSDGTLITHTNSGSKQSLDVMQTNKIIQRAFSEIEVTAKNSNGDPTSIVFRQGIFVVANMNITYDSDGDLEKVTVTYP